MRYSKQREVILSVVQDSCDHPSAETIYKRVRKIIPNISLGTIYRNLNALGNSKFINKISIPDEVDRFDKTLDMHCHFYCENCLDLIDIDSKKISQLEKEIYLDSGNKITSHSVVFKGSCKKCEKREGENYGY